MDRNDIPALQAQVNNVVRHADARGDIDAGRFTLKIAKQEIARALGVDVDVLNQKQWKQIVKDLVFEAIENVDTLKSSPVKPPTPQQKADQLAFIRDMLSDEERAERRNGNGNGGGKGKARRAISPQSEASESPRPSARKKIKLDTEDEGSDVGTKERKRREGKVRGKGKGKATTAAAPPEDERVKELKSIVVACGVRKQWKKEFQDMQTAEEQVAHLMSLLRGLGMKGQPTRGKARVVKEKRELAAELGDVLEFEAKRGLGITRTRDGHAEAEHEAPVTSRKPRVAAAKGKRVSEAFVASESSEGDVRSEEGGDSESGDEGKKAATNGGKQPKRKAVASSDDSDTE